MGGKHANYSVVARCTIGTGCRPVLVARNLGNGASFDGGALRPPSRVTGHSIARPLEGLTPSGSNGISNVKLVPLTDAGRVTSAPSCYATDKRTLRVDFPLSADSGHLGETTATPYYFVPLWQFAWQNVKQLALRFAISQLFEHFSKHAAVNATKDQLKAMPQFDTTSKRKSRRAIAIARRLSGTRCY